MDQDQLSTFNPNHLSVSHPSDLNAIYLQPGERAAKSSARQQVLDRILNKIAEQDLLGKSYVEQYLRHKYRRNCKANTLRQAATSNIKSLAGS